MQNLKLNLGYLNQRHRQIPVKIGKKMQILSVHFADGTTILASG